MVTAGNTATLTLCAALALGGCAPPGGVVDRIALFGGAVTALGPTGYCVDPAVSRPGDGFAVLAPCGMIARTSGDIVAQKAVVTVQAGVAGSASVAGSEPALAGLLQSREGAALLSSTGDGAAIRVLHARPANNRVSVYFQDSNPAPVQGTQQNEWRVFMDVKGRLVTVSLRGLAPQPLSEDVGQRLLDQVVDAMAAANAG